MRYLLLIPVLIYIAASLWANFNLFPKDFMQYWWFDDLGHIVVFGSLAAVALTITHLKRIPSSFGILLVMSIAIVDEFSQLFLTYRSFSLSDLMMSLLGVTLAYILYQVYRQLT